MWALRETQKMWRNTGVMRLVMGSEPQVIVTKNTQHWHVSSTSKWWQRRGGGPNLHRPPDQVMLCKKRISGNWILLAQAQEFSLQWSWMWRARNASSIVEGRDMPRRGAGDFWAQGSGVWHWLFPFDTPAGLLCDITCGLLLLFVRSESI